MTVETDRQSWEHLRELAAANDRDGLDAAISALEPDEAVRAILHLDPADQRAMLTTLSPPEAADLIEDAPDEQAADLIEQLAPADAAAIVTEMQSDEQADLIADLRRERGRRHPRRVGAGRGQRGAGHGRLRRRCRRRPDDHRVPRGRRGRDRRAPRSTQLVVNAEDSDDHFSRYVYVLSSAGAPGGRRRCLRAGRGGAEHARRRRDGAATLHQRPRPAWTTCASSSRPTPSRPCRWSTSAVACWA